MPVVQLASTATSYVIQLQISAGQALTAVSGTKGAAICLQPLHGAGAPTQKWVLDPISGIITLATTFGMLSPLVLDIEARQPAGPGPLVLSAFVLARHCQRWNFTGAAPCILSQAFPNLVVDCVGGSMSTGTIVQVAPLVPGDRRQAWTCTSVAMIVALLQR